MDPSLCQATRNRPATVVLSSTSPDGPYRLCDEAAGRLKSSSLTPREWYNLAVIHGPMEGHLHDDMYDESGVADQNDEPVPIFGDERDRIPTIEEVQHDIDLLLDYLYTRWSITETHLEAVRLHSPQDVLSAASKRYVLTANDDFHSVLELILGSCTRQAAASWFRSRFRTATSEARLRIVSNARFSLPLDECFEVATTSLHEIASDKRHNHLYCLFTLAHPQTKLWIEQNACSPVTNVWGALAAVCNTDWLTTLRWLRSGRPLSLIALDSIADRIPDRYRTWSKIPRPRLFIPGGKNELLLALHELALNDTAPRVEDVLSYIVRHIDEVLEH